MLDSLEWPSNLHASYYMKIENDQQELESCNEEKDIGIIFDSELNLF